MSDQERLLKLIDDLGWMATLEVLQDWRDWKNIQDAAIDQALDLGDVVDGEDHRREISELNSEIAAAEKSAENFRRIDVNQIYDAICEGRRDDAIEILTGITGERFRSIRAQHNLFPDWIFA